MRISAFKISASCFRSFKLLLVAAVMTFGMLGVQAVRPARVSAADYPYQSATACGYSAWCINGNMNSPYTYVYRNCTDYVAWKLSTKGVPADKYKYLGNANQWGGNASTKGVTVNTTPAVGSAAISTTLSSYGHVAYVEAVNGDGTIDVSQYNYAVDGNYSTAHGTPAALGYQTFAHFEAFQTSQGSSQGTSNNVIKVKKTKANDGAQQIYTATTSDVYESWWYNGGDGVHKSKVINIAQNNIVDFDKLELPNGVQSMYTAVPDGVWETWWTQQDGVHSAKIISGLSGVKGVIADKTIESNGAVTHLVYVLAADGPYEYWWRDGGDGIHSAHLASINNPITFVRTVTNGVNQIYTATAGAVWETWWTPGQTTPTQTASVIGISQNNIVDIDKLNQLDGTQVLYTATSSGIWESKWGGSQGPLAHNYIVNNLSGIVDIKKRIAPDGTNQLYAATGSQVQEYWWNASGGGGSTLINISQNNIKSIDRSVDGSAQQLYTGAGTNVWETWWGDGSLHQSNPPIVSL